MQLLDDLAYIATGFGFWCGLLGGLMLLKGWYYGWRTDT